jgi:hypothetical protein
MAWTEQCKIAFRMNALGKLAKYKNKSRKVNGVLRELSRESDIPFNTLKRWYYEKTTDSISVKNDTDKVVINPKKKGIPKALKDLQKIDKQLANHLKRLRVFRDVYVSQLNMTVEEKRIMKSIRRKINELYETVTWKDHKINYSRNGDVKIIDVQFTEVK